MAPTLSTRVSRLFAAIFTGFALHFVSAGALAAQTVHGRLVDVMTGAGIDRAFIVLLDHDAIEVNRVITDSRGDFSVAAPGAGRYRLRSERIGFQSVVSDFFELGVIESHEVAMNVRPVVIRLDTIRVEDAAKECRVIGEQGLATATVWDEARKHLAAVAQYG